MHLYLYIKWFLKQLVLMELQKNKTNDDETITANVRKLSKRVDNDKSHPLLGIHFSSTSSSFLPWTFEPEQPDIYIQSGESPLAFYRFKNE